MTTTKTKTFSDTYRDMYYVALSLRIITGILSAYLSVTALSVLLHEASGLVGGVIGFALFAALEYFGKDGIAGKIRWEMQQETRHYAWIAALCWCLALTFGLSVSLVYVGMKTHQDTHGESAANASFEAEKAAIKRVAAADAQALLDKQAKIFATMSYRGRLAGEAAKNYSELDRQLILIAGQTTAKIEAAKERIEKAYKADTAVRLRFAIFGIEPITIILICFIVAFRKRAEAECGDMVATCDIVETDGSDMVATCDIVEADSSDIAKVETAGNGIVSATNPSMADAPQAESGETKIVRAKALIAMGKSNREIAEVLCCNIKTVQRARNEFKAINN